MMRRISFVLIGLLGMALAAWAGDPWKQKAYKDWDEKDLRQILYDSPWAKKMSITAMSGVASVSAGPPSQSPDAGAGSYSGSGGGVSGGTPNSVNTAAGALMNESTFTIRWFSAKTMRRAIGRDAVRRHGLTEEQAEQALAAPVDDYTILVIGPGMYNFLGLDEAAIKKFTYLRPKKTKEKLVPLKVDIQRSADGKSIGMLVFHFAKKTESGEATIATDEKGIEFVCEPRAITIRVTFEPPKMVGQEGPDW